MLPVLFLGATFVMACVAQGVAQLFERFEPLEAYRLDIAGSLLGIVAFSALSFLGAGPLVWGLVLGVCFVVLVPPEGYAGWWPAVAAAVVVLSLGSFASIGRLVARTTGSRCIPSRDRGRSRSA